MRFFETESYGPEDSLARKKNAAASRLDAQRALRKVQESPRNGAAEATKTKPRGPADG
jgi:hypothetical protein